MQSVKDNFLLIALRQCWTVSSCQTTSSYMEALFISIRRMSPFWPQLLMMISLVITPGLYLHHVQVANQEPASDSL